MQKEEIVDRLLDHARYGEYEDFLRVAKDYFVTTNVDPEKPSDDAIRNLFRLAKNKDGNTTLHFIAANNHHYMLDILIKSLTPDELNVMNNIGSTPCHWAALNGSIDCIKILARAGANLTLVNSQGKSALTIAETNGYLDVAQEILNYIDLDKEGFQPIVDDVN